MLKIENETDLHCKVVQYIRRFYPDDIIIAGLGENQHTAAKRYCFMKKGYMKGQPDIVIIKSTTASALSLKVKPIIIKSVNSNWRCVNGINKIDIHLSFPIIMMRLSPI